MHVTLARAALAACALAFASAASAASDNVLSGNIKEADGISGQDTNNGSGVKTGHLQDGAVTAPKLAPAAVGTAAISDGAVSGAKLAPGAVGAPAIADGAVTPAKLSGAIPAAKIERAGLDADSVDGYHSGDFSPIGHDHVLSDVQGMDAFRKKHRNVVVVAADGTGDFADPAAAVASITDASEANPYLVKIMAGQYVVKDALMMKPFVDLEGSGQGVTSLVMSESPGPNPYFLLVADSEVRSLTVRAVDRNGMFSDTRGGVTRLTDVTIHRSASGANPTFTVAGVGFTMDAVLTRVTILVDAAPSHYGDLYAISSSYEHTVTLRDCDVIARAALGTARGLQTGWFDVVSSRVIVSSAATTSYGSSYGIIWADAKVSGSRVEVTAPKPVGVIESSIEIAGSEVVARSSSGSGEAFRIIDGRSLWAAHTKVDGAVVKVGTGVTRCVGLYDATYAPVSCP